MSYQIDEIIFVLLYSYQLSLHSLASASLVFLPAIVLRTTLIMFYWSARTWSFESYYSCSANSPQRWLNEYGNILHTANAGVVLNILSLGSAWEACSLSSHAIQYSVRMEYGPLMSTHLVFGTVRLFTSVLNTSIWQGSWHFKFHSLNLFANNKDFKQLQQHCDVSAVTI